MTEIEKATEDLKAQVAAETDQAAAQNLLLDGIIGTVASGVSTIKDLAQQLLVVANDPQMVRDIAAQLKTTTQAHADKLAALQAASGELASAVVANTPAATGTSTGTSTSAGATTTPGATSEPTPEPATATEAPATTPATAMSTTATPDTTTTTDTGGQMDPVGGSGNS